MVGARRRGTGRLPSGLTGAEVDRLQEADEFLAFIRWRPAVGPAFATGGGEEAVREAVSISAWACFERMNARISTT